MIRARWRVEDLRAAVENARALGAELGNSKVLAPTVLRQGRELQQEIERTAPRDKTAPHMGDDFIAKVSSEDKDEGRVTVLVGPHQPRSSASNGAGWRAPLIEFGTSKMAPRPFIRPAFERMRVEYVRNLTEELRRTYDRVVKRYAARAKRASK